ncbi:O-antigen ligase family protein [Bifidobacterium pseudocatenulatum]|uniref:O-antigen ligase family protein n=1 Tax=Bifidobacterium pseudocatenulatum TaxID=28026 RepID=UPI001CFCD997|nr:O-antigen ligase family protein [Bifidobacterium pseudocatenulatum]MCB4916679.1 O-antigen ligase family protein [Bifidobacterium pseudocatenulatum]
MDALYIFITTALPKAGAQVAGLPLTLNLLLTAYVILRHPNQTLLMMQRFRGLAVAYGTLFVFGVLSMLMAVAQGMDAFRLSQMIVVVGSPLAGIAATRITSKRFSQIIICSLIIVNVYGLIQYFVGIENTSVAGLTYTLGQSIDDKPIGLKADGTAEKIISTYQNGNSLGIFNALGISFMLTSAQSSRFWKIGQYFALSLGLIGIMLSGSRSIQIPFLLFLIILLVQFIKQLPPRKRGMTLSISGTILAFGIVYLLAQRTIINQFIDRLVKQTLADPTASGRTNQWSHSFEVISHMDGGQVLRQLLFGRSPHTDIGGEGLPEFFFMFGIVSTAAFYGGLLYIVWCCWQRRSSRTIAIGILCVFCAFCVDQSFYYPPNIMNVALFAAAALNRDGETSRRCLSISVSK